MYCIKRTNDKIKNFPPDTSNVSTEILSFSILMQADTLNITKECKFFVRLLHTVVLTGRESQKRLKRAEYLIREKTYVLQRLTDRYLYSF